MLISDSLNSTPPTTGLNWPSDGPSRSILVMTSALATATCTAAATLIEDSIMQPIMQSTPYSAAMSAMRIALEMPPVFISLMLMMSAARRWIRSNTCCGANTLSSAITGVLTRSVTYLRPSMSAALTGCSSSSRTTPASSSLCMAYTACLAVQPWLASRRSRARPSTAAWIALTRSMSRPRSLPTLILSDSKPRSSAASESATILSM